MKKMIFLMTLIGIFILHTNVHASTTQFYEAETIDNIYTKSLTNKKIKYQKARFFRRVSDNKAAYCIEPFALFADGSNYESHINPDTIDQNTWYNMSLIAFYGYNYQNHTDSKWYAITQLMIWQEADKDARFIFTDTLNGNKIDIYQDEINEVKNLIQNHQKIPSFAGNSINIVTGTKTIIDNNNILSSFKEKDNLININNNSIDTSKLKKGTYQFNFVRNNQTDNEPVLFYYNNNSQNLMTRGNISEPAVTLTVNVYDTQINIQKIDKDTNSKTPSGEGKLNETIFELFDQDKKPIKEIKLDTNSHATVENINFGTYYLKEKKAGTGYKTDDSYHKIVINKDNTHINLTIENKIIEKEISIHKEYGTEGNTIPEENITFEIYDKNNQLIKTITTDNLGNGKIKLPYGTYTFKQKNSKQGYKLVDDFTIVVNEETTELSYNLFDYKIPVPNTRSNNNYHLGFILLFSLLIIYYDKKKCNS